MKLLLAFFLGLASAGWSACASGTLYYGNPMPTDACGSNSLTVVGTVPTANWGCQGTANPVSFTTANYFKAVSYTGTLVTSMRSATNYTIEGYYYLPAVLTNAYLFSTTAAGTFKEFFQVSEGVTTAVRYGVKGTQQWLWADSTGVGKCRYYRIEGTATYSRLWIGDNGAAPVVVTGTASNGAWEPTTDTLYMGNFTGSAGAMHMIASQRFSNVLQPTIPTTDLSTARGVRSPWDAGPPYPSIQEPEPLDAP